MLINVNVRELTAKDADKVKFSMKPDRYVKPEAIHKDKLHKIYYVNMNNKETQFTPKEHSIVTVGRTCVLVTKEELAKMTNKQVTGNKKSK